MKLTLIATLDTVEEFAVLAAAMAAGVPVDAISTTATQTTAASLDDAAAAKALEEMRARLRTGVSDPTNLLAVDRGLLDHGFIPKLPNGSAPEIKWFDPAKPAYATAYLNSNSLYFVRAEHRATLAALPGAVLDVDRYVRFSILDKEGATNALRAAAEIKA